MAMQSGKSPLAGKVKGLGAAARANVGKPIEIGRSRLPAGIDGGVARLSQIGLGTFEPDHKNAEFRGKPYFSAMGVVALPEQHDGKPTRGLQTWLQRIPLFDTPRAAGKYKTLADHFNRMRSHLTSLGFDVDAACANIPPNAPDEAVLAVIEVGCKALESQKPYFRFRTWQGKKDEIVERGGKWFVVRRGGELGPYSSKELLLKANPYAENDPLVNEQWEGACPYEENGEAPVVQDDTGEAATEEAAETAGNVANEVTDEAGTEADAGDVDLDALATAADAKDTNAQQQIDAIADGLGLTEECGAAATYVEAVEIIKAAQTTTEGGDAVEGEPAVEEGVEEEPVADEPWQPAPGEEYKWKPADPKDKSGKRRLKPISVIVEKVQEAKETVTVKSNVTKKLITVSAGPNKGKPLAIKWSELEQA